MGVFSLSGACPSEDKDSYRLGIESGLSPTGTFAGSRSQALTPQINNKNRLFRNTLVIDGRASVNIVAARYTSRQNKYLICINRAGESQC
jgi:hypothetical protein